LSPAARTAHSHLCSQKWIGVTISVIVIGLSSGARAWYILERNLPFVPILTVRPDLGDITGEYGDQVYPKPWFRIGPYLVGLLAGLIMFKTKGKLKLHVVCGRARTHTHALHNSWSSWYCGR
jgi:hypothetical protein